MLFRPTRQSLNRTLFGLALVVVLVVAYVSYTAYDPFSLAIALYHFTGKNAGVTLSPQPPTNSTILLVSAFFPLTHSKHPMGAYKTWLSNFLEPIHTPVYMFTTPELEPIIRELRGSNPYPLTINTTFSSPFEIPPLRDMEAEYEEMWHWDREQKRHGPDLYAVWNAKPYFLDEGLKNSNKAREGEYEFAFWIDAGSFRDSHSYVDWPDHAKVKEVWNGLKEMQEDGMSDRELILIPMWDAPGSQFREWEESMGPVDTEFSEGSFFGGTPSSITWWRQVYYAYHDEYRSRQIFVGKDQTLINALLLLFPERMATVWVRDPSRHFGITANQIAEERGIESEWDPEDGRCGNPWYYFEWWVASDSERKSMNEVWKKSLERSRWWWEAFWWVMGVDTKTDDESSDVGSLERRRCRETSAILIERLLRRDNVFGPDWIPPTRTTFVQ